MAQISPPPTYADVIVIGKNKQPQFNPLWLKWFLDIAKILSSSGGSSGTINHNSTGGLQGGTTNQFYHLTSAEHSALQGWQGNQVARAVLSGPLSGAATAASFKVMSRIAHKNSDQSLTTTTTLTNDNDLTFAIAANEDWIGRCYIDVGAALATTGIKVSLTAPAGAVGGFIAGMILDSVNAGDVAMQRTNTFGAALDFTAANLNTVSNALLEISFHVLNGATPGSVTVQFAQSTSSGTALTFRTGSQLKTDRVA